MKIFIGWVDNYIYPDHLCASADENEVKCFLRDWAFSLEGTTWTMDDEYSFLFQTARNRPPLSLLISECELIESPKTL